MADNWGSGGGGGGGGDNWGGGGGRATSKGKKRGGVLGAISRIPGATASDLYHMALNTPAGVAQFAGAEYSALKSTVQHPIISRSKAAEMWSHPLRAVPGTANTPQITQFGKANLVGIEQTVQHPLRHPGQTALLVLPVASGVAKLGLAARAGATGIPLAETRSLTLGGETVHPELSRSGLGQVTQLALDKSLQSRAAKNPAGRAAKKLETKIGKVQTARRRQAEAIAAGPAKAVMNLGRKLTPGEQKALEIVAEEAPLKGRITAASARVVGAKTPEARARHQVELDLLHKAQEHLAESDGLPAFAPEATKLAGVYGRMAKVAGDRTTLLKGLGLLSDEAAANRLTGAGRISLGARYEAPTPGKLGKPSASLLRQRAYVARLSTLHERALVRRDKAAAEVVAKEPPSAAGVHPTEKPPPDPYEDLQRRRIAELDAKHADPNDPGYRNMWSSAARLDFWTKGKGTLRDKSIAFLDRSQAKRVEREAKQPAAVAATRPPLVPPVQIGGKILSGPSVLSAPHAARAERIGAALSVAKDKLTQMEEAAGRRVQSTGIIGQEQFVASENAVRIPDVTTRKGSRQLRSNAITQVAGQGVLGEPRLPGSVTHSYTGALRESGYRKQYTGYRSRQYSPTAQVAQSSMEASKYEGMKYIQESAQRMASSTPRHFTKDGKVDDIAVRLDKMGSSEKLSPHVRQLMNDPEEFVGAHTPEEAMSAFEKVRQSVFMDPRTLTSEENATLQQLYDEGKIGWVPRRALGSLAKPSAPLSSILGKRSVGVIDAINNGQRLAILYLKPAYAVPNLLGNVALNLLQQGAAAPHNLRDAAWLNHVLGPELTGRIDAATNEGFVRSLSAHGAGPGSRIVDMSANVWSKLVDVPFRRSSFLYEAKRAGYRTPQKLEQLLTDPAKREDLIDVSIKANREMIDYANLSNREREIVRRVIFFYPWVKGSTIYAGRMLREHPVGSAVIGTLGARGYEQYQKDFPLAPSYLEGSIKVGNRIVNPAAASILGTPAQVGRTIADIGTGRISNIGNPEGFYTPAMSLAQALVSRQTGSGYPYPTGTNAAKVAEDQLFAGLPQLSLYRNLRSQAPYSGQAPMYPPSPVTGLGRFLIGGLYPRPVNWQRVRQSGATERSKLGG